jgi:hypothetical protein
VTDVLGVVIGSEIFSNILSPAQTVPEPIGLPTSVDALKTETARSAAARDLVEQELETLLQKLPNDPSLFAHKQALGELTPP